MQGGAQLMKMGTIPIFIQNGRTQFGIGDTYRVCHRNLRADDGGNVLQCDLLEIEGICIDEKQRIDLSVYGWTFLE
jgi:hypothetical protein